MPRDLSPTHHRHEGDAYSVIPGPPHTCIVSAKCEGVVVLTPAEVAQMLADERERIAREIDEACLRADHTQGVGICLRCHEAHEIARGAVA